MATYKLNLLIVLAFVGLFIQIGSTHLGLETKFGTQNNTNRDIKQCPDYDDCWSCYGDFTCPTEATCEPCWCPTTVDPCDWITCPPCPTTQGPCPTTTRAPCTQPTCPPPPTFPSATPCPTAPPSFSAPTFSKIIYETSLASWPTAGSTVHLGISAETPGNDPIVYSLVDPPQFVTLAANQDIIFTTTVSEGAFVGPNNVMVLEVNASVYWDDSISSSAAIIIVFPKGSFVKDVELPREIKQESTTLGCPYWYLCESCWYGGSCTTLVTCPICECPTQPPCYCPECGSTHSPCPDPVTWPPCPSFSCPAYTTEATVTCPTTPSPKDAAPKFSKTIYETSLASWPTAGTTVHLGISAETPGNDPIVYTLIDPPQFVTLAANQDIIFTTNVAEGAFVGPNNVMVLAINATSYFDTTLSSSAAIVVVFPQ